MDIAPEPWHWHDSSGRKDGQGNPIGLGRGITGDEPPVGSGSRFSFCVSDARGSVIARCSNALITMDSRRSERHTRLMAASPRLLSTLIQAVESSGFSLSGPTDSRAAEHGEPAWVCEARAIIAEVTV